MAYQYLTQLFTGGLNKDMDPAALDLAGQNNVITQVADCRNILFERGLALIRPGLIPLSLPNPPAAIPSNMNVRAIRSLPFAARSLQSPYYDRAAFAVTDYPTLYALEANARVANVLTPTPIIGSGFTQQPNYSCSNAIVNGVVMIGGNSTGLIRWDPSTTAYTIVANSPYQYVTGHTSRAVAAYRLGSSSVGYAKTVAWSVQGDETTWTGSTNGSGSAILADVTDSITGLKTVKGVVVIARAYGFHMGVPTGQFPVAYNWIKLSDESIGCMWPDSLVAYKDLLFFVSESGIHTFDLVDVEDIGEGVYQEINNLARIYNCCSIRGFMSYGLQDFQPSYNLVLDSVVAQAGNIESALPHYMYNLREKKWSRHFYTLSGDNGCLSPLVASIPYLFYNGTSAATLDPPSTQLMLVYNRLPGSNTSPRIWAYGAPLDDAAGALLTTGQLTLDEPMMDIQLERVLLTYYAPPSISGVLVQLTAQCILNGSLVSVSASFTTYPAGGWDRRWFNLRITGNMMQLYLSFPANIPGPCKIKSMMLEYTTTGKVRT